MKIVGVSFGTRDGSNDCMCKEALMGAQEMGAEVEFIHLHDWNIQHCTGCVACSRALTMGKGNICSIKDDFDAFRSKLLDADGVLFVSPIFESGASGLLHTICDRFGPRFDRGMNFMADGLAKAGKGKEIDQRLLKDKVVSFIGIGGSDWTTRIQCDHAMVAMSPAWKIIDNECFSWSKTIIMEDEKVARVHQIGVNLAKAAANYDEAKYMGAEGVCPHCHGRNFYLVPEENKATCVLCGIEGKLDVVDGKFKFTFDDEWNIRAHDTMSGKKLHGDDVLNNEMRTINLPKDPEFIARKQKYKDFIQPTPAPSK